MSAGPILVFGETLVDVLLPEERAAISMRLGGIAHAARALSALGAEFNVAFAAPEYLERASLSFFSGLGAVASTSVGVVSGAPNVILVRDRTEAGDQGYELLLRGEKAVDVNWTELANLAASASSVLAFPEPSMIEPLVDAITPTDARLHVDVDVDFSFLSASDTRRVSTLFLSTSSSTFGSFEPDIDSLAETALAAADAFFLKENRGGTRIFRLTESTLRVTAQPRRAAHSVGVGDVFDATVVALQDRFDVATAASYASHVAAAYASTLSFATFREEVARILALKPSEILELRGVSLPWEARRDFSIYIAAPDFDHVDCTQIDRVDAALSYHGFVVRRPVREHGQLTAASDSAERRHVAEADIRLLYDCSVVIAVLPYDDPGTLVEAGIAVERGIPLIVYDPAGRVTNPMVTEFAYAMATRMDDVVSAVFRCLGE